MNAALDLTCLGPLNIIVDKSSLDFSPGNGRLYLAEGSSISFINGGTLVGGSCNASERIYIGNKLFASCNGNAGAVVPFDIIIDMGGTGNLTSNSPVCVGNTINLSATPPPNGTYTYSFSGSGISGSGTPYSSNSNYSLTAPSSSGTYVYIVKMRSSLSGNPIMEREIIVTVNPSGSTITPTVTLTQPTCTAPSGTITITAPTGFGMKYSINNLTYTTSNIFIGLAPGSYTVTAKNVAGCTSIASTNVVIIAQPANNVWNGSVSTDWNTGGNWSCGEVPTISTDVLIPTIPTGGKYPILRAFIDPAYPEGYAKNIVFESGTKLIIENNALNVAGILTLNGKIDLNYEAQLVQDTGSTFDAASTGTIEIDQQGTGNSFRYNYWSSPVNSRGATYTIDEVLRDENSDSLTNKNISYEAAHTWADGVASVSPAFIKLSTYWMYVLRNSGAGYAAWYRVGNTGEVWVGEGYTMKGSNTSSSEQNYTFVGQPNNGDITLPLNPVFDYLVGNPYPSAIEVSKFLLNNQNSILGGTIYFWEHYGGDTHNLAGYQAGYATRNLLDGAPAASHPNVSSVVASDVIKKIPGPYIPVGQAFFVVGDADGGDINFKNSQRVFVKESQFNGNGDPLSVFMKTSNTKAKNTDSSLDDLRPKFRIGFDAPKISHRQLLFGVDERATPGVDWGFDAEIYEVFADDMYWMLEGKKYVIQGTNEVGLNSEVQLGIQLSKTGIVTVKIDAIENVDDNTAVYLKDKLTGESFNMREKPVELNLTAGKYADRFVLIFKTQKLMAEDVNAEILIPAAAQTIIEGIHVFMNNAMGELQIKNNSTEEIVSVALINAVGQTLKTWNSNFNTRTISLPISTTTGVYLVQINTKTGKTVKKISVE